MNRIRNNRLPYYAVLKDNLVCFLIFEAPSLHCFVGFPKLVPTKVPKKDNPKIRYNRKVNSYSEWFIKPPKTLLKYLKYVPAFDANLFCFPNNEISRIIHPLDYLKYVNQNKTDSPHIKLTKHIVKKLSKVSGISEKVIGIEGSTLLSTFNNKSDIDIFVYGFKNARKVAANFRKLDLENNIRLYGECDKEFILKKRVNFGYGDTEKSIFEQEKRRFYGFINSKRFSVINVLGVDEKEIVDLNRQIKYKSIFNGKIKIIDDKYSVVTPSIVYGISEKTGIKYRVELIDHYGINQARIGEKYFVRAKLFEDLKTKEQIIIIAFWNGIKQSFNLLA